MPFGPFGEYVSTSVEVPLTNECKRILTFAVEEAANSKHEYVGVEHLLLGILREQRCLAARLLQARRVEIDAIRQKIMPHLPKEERSHDAATEQPIAIRKVIVAVLDAWRTRGCTESTSHSKRRLQWSGLGSGIGQEDQNS
jgi:ATP-dependent Clp protease ATP-binding subunit ClpA